MIKPNGNGNGHDKDEKKIVRFPTLAERDRARKEKEKSERDRQQASTQNQKNPFINFDRIPIFTRILIGSFIAVHLLVTLALSSGDALKAVYLFGFIPGYFTGAMAWEWSAPLGIVTHMFIHGGWMHLIINCVMGLVFCMFFEREFGSRRAAIFFFACGLAGALTYFALSPFDTAPVIGASGGISGLFAAILMIMHQRNQLGSIGRRGPWSIIIFWALFMIGMGLFGGDNLAWQAHVGGFLAGALLLRGLQKGIVRF